MVDRGEMTLAGLVAHVGYFTVFTVVGDVRVNNLVDTGTVVIAILKSPVLAEVGGGDELEGVLGVRVRIRGRVAKGTSVETGGRRTVDDGDAVVDSIEAGGHGTCNSQKGEQGHEQHNDFVDVGSHCKYSRARVRSPSFLSRMR